MGIPFTTLNNVSHCLASTESKGLFGSIIAVVGVVVIMDILCCIFSRRGGIMDTHKRSQVPWILTAILLLSFVQIALNCANLYMATKYPMNCKVEVTRSFIAGNSLNMIHTVILFILLMLNYREAGAFWGRIARDYNHSFKGFLPQTANDSTKNMVMQMRSESIRRKLKRLGGLRGPRPRTDPQTKEGEQMAINSAADLFSEVFYDVDLVASDVTSGLLLLRWQTNQWVGTGHRVPMCLIERDTFCSYKCDETGDNGEVTDCSILRPPKSDSLLINPNNLPAYSSWLHIERIRRAAQFATAIYGKLLYYSLSLKNPMSGFRLCRHIECYCDLCCHNDDDSVIPTNICCGKHSYDAAAVLEMTGLKKSQFIKFCYENTVYRSPHFVAFDDENNSIVIAVRGTLSFEDAIVDLLYDGSRLLDVESYVESQTGSRPTFIGHRGMVESARHIYEQLINERTIELAKSKKPHYNLVVCGHSLGAGIASFLTLFLLRDYPDVKGYALSAPLGVMNQELSHYLKPCLISVVYGYDIFARLNKATLIDFKWRLLDALTVCKVPKHELLSRGFSLCLRRYLSKLCSDCCRPITIGQDTRLLDLQTQDRLTYPNPQLNLDPTNPNIQSNSTNLENQNSSSSTGWPSRLRPGSRSLICWANSSSLHLFRVESTKPDQITNMASPSGDKSDATLSNEQDQSCELFDGISGGLLLHIVDVTFDEPNLVADTSVPNSVDRETSKGQSQSHDSERLLRSTDSRKTCFSKKSNRKTMSVGVWSNHQQFQTILIHPRMLLDHFPQHLLGALTRLRDQIMNQCDEILSNETPRTYLKPYEVIRVLKTV